MPAEDQSIEQELPPLADGAPATPPPAPGPPPVAGDAAGEPHHGEGEGEGEAAAETGESGPGDETADLRARAAKADDYLALAQRTQADFENFRKRMARDVKAAEARGMGRIARELLPALDNLERAAAALEASDQDNHHLSEGIRLVTAELSAALRRTGIEGYAAKGERFDPVCHEAVAQQAVEGTEPGTILEVLQAGYRLNEAILRPARVIVAG